MTVPSNTFVGPISADLRSYTLAFEKMGTEWTLTTSGRRGAYGILLTHKEVKT